MSKIVKDPFANASYIKLAMKLSYNGRPFNGFELVLDKNQPNSSTVEGKLFEAMHSTTMIKDPVPVPKDIDYSKAGRTDAGVSGICNVISVKVRKMCGRNYSLRRGEKVWGDSQQKAS